MIAFKTIMTVILRSAHIKLSVASEGVVDQTAATVSSCLQLYNISSNAMIKVINMPNVPSFRMVLVPKGSSNKVLLSDGVTDHIINNGKWEPKISQSVLASMSKGAAGTLLDIGGNIGWYTLLVLAAGHRVITVEASLDNAALIKASVCINGFQDRFRLHEVALGSVKQSCVAVSHDHNNRDWVLVCPEEKLVELTKVSNAIGLGGYKVRGKVQTVFLDDIIRSEDKISVLKIDIEGYEPMALSYEGANKTFHRQSICNLYTEVVPWAARLAAGTDAVATVYLDRLRDWGYDCDNQHAKKQHANSRQIFDIHCQRKKHALCMN